MGAVELDARPRGDGCSCAERNTSQSRCGCIAVTFGDASETNPICRMTNIETVIVLLTLDCEGTEPERGMYLKIN